MNKYEQIQGKRPDLSSRSTGAQVEKQTTGKPDEARERNGWSDGWTLLVLYGIMYELAICSDGKTEAQPRSFRQKRPAIEHITTRKCASFISLLHHTSQRKAIIKGEGELDVEKSFSVCVNVHVLLWVWKSGRIRNWSIHRNGAVTVVSDKRF